MKIDALRKDYAASVKLRSDKEDRARQLQEELRQLNADAEAAAMDGDVEKYKEIQKEISSKGADLFVLRKTLGKKIITPERTRDSWTEYAADYAGRFKKAQAKLEKAKLALREAYEDCITCENDALQIREELAGMVGEDPAEYEMPAIMPNEQPHPVPSSRVVAPEFRYMFASGLWKNTDFVNVPARTTCDTVLVEKTSIAEPKF